MDVADESFLEDLRFKVRAGDINGVIEQVKRTGADTRMIERMMKPGFGAVVGLMRAGVGMTADVSGKIEE